MQDLDMNMELEEVEQSLKRMSLSELKAIQNDIFRKTGNEVYVGFDNGQPKIV